MWAAADDPNALPFVAWGDGGCHETEYLWTPFTKFEIRAQPALAVCNTVMASVRVSAEHGWSMVTQLFPLLKHATHLQVFSMPVGLYLPLAVFFVNCVTCFKGRNRLSDFFGLSPPTLAVYLNGRE